MCDWRMLLWGDEGLCGQSQIASPVFTLISWLRVSISPNEVDMNPASGYMQSQEFCPSLGERNSF